MSRILLVNPNIPMKRYLIQAELYPNGALLLLGTILKNKGHIVKVIHMTADGVGLEQLGDIVKNFKPDIVGLTAITFQSRTLREVSKVVKRADNGVRVVAGGSHLSALISIGHPVAEDYPDIDYFVGGEGDFTIDGIIEQEPASNIIIVEPLDNITTPPMDLGVTNIHRFSGDYPPGPRPAMFVMGSRGCPFKCLPAGEKVLMADGKTSKCISEVRAGDIVMSVNENGELSNSCVATTRRTPTRYDIVKVTSGDGGVLRCTADHLVLTIKGWLQAGKLKVGDWIGKGQIYDNERRNSQKGLSQDIGKESETILAYRETQRASKAENNCQPANEEPSYCREKQAVTTCKSRGKRTSTTTDVGEQSNETSRYSSQSQCQYASSQSRSNRENKETICRRENSSRYNVGCCSPETKRTNETKQPNAYKGSERQGNAIPQMACIIQPQKLFGAMVSEASRSQFSREEIGDTINADGLSVCGRREILDRPLSEWQMPKPRFSLEKRQEQDSITLQLDILAQSAISERRRGDGGLQWGGMEGIRDYRRDAGIYARDNQPNTKLVRFSQVVSILPDIPAEVYDIETIPHHNFIASDFVVHNCTFCSRSVFGNTVRYREPIAVVDDIEKLAKDWGVKEVFFHDDTFNLNREWVEEALSHIIRRKLNKKLCFRTSCRVNKRLLDLGLLRLMKEANFWLILYGVESGNQMMLDRMHKGTTTEEIKRAFRLTKEVGFKTVGTFIVGLPGETKETIQESINLWKEIKPDWCSFTRAIPYPGTELYKEVKQLGYLLMDSFDDIEVDRTLCRTEALTGEEVEKYAVILEDMVSRGKLWQLLRHPAQLVRVLGELKNDKGVKRGIKRAWQLLPKVTL